MASKKTVWRSKKRAATARKRGAGRGKKTATKTAAQQMVPLPDNQSPTPNLPVLPVVGIGASAGGLEAIVELLSELPGDTGMAFVFIQHYKPGQPSMLTEILHRNTPLNVVAVCHGQPLQPDTIHVHASYQALGIRNGVLVIHPEKEMPDRHLPIDYFFQALVQCYGSRAIGVVLSGTASDGTLGLKAIKAAGGITMVQEVESARYDGMPASAIAAGAATFVLTSPQIGRELARIARHPYLMANSLKTGAEVESIEEGDIHNIFTLLHNRFGVDFSYYKHSTIMRRIRRRMVIQRLDELAEYTPYLEQHPDEQDALYHDMLINVTGFFRDPEVFEMLQAKILPQLLERRKNTDDPLRIWVPGCASGEEVYSIAITLIEVLQQHQLPQLPIQIFATDIDEQAIEQARSGIYPSDIAQAVSAEYLHQYFIKVPQGYQINKQIRDLCIFSRHNVIKDPPFSRLDLISCRNLLIYLGPVLQKKILPIFHFALRPVGYLLLGTAESIGGASNLFEIVDKTVKLYSKKSVETPMEFEFHPPGQAAVSATAKIAEKGTKPTTRFNLHQAVEELLVREYSPPAVVIDEQMNIIEFRGHTGRFLEPAAGEASLHLLKMAREGLVAELRAAVIRAIEKKQRVYKRDLRADFEDGQRNISFEVIPIRDGGGQHVYLVVFHETSVPISVPAGEGPVAGEHSPDQLEHEIQALQQELAGTKEYLHSVIEQQELTNEDLRCANEEVQSSYEELQSTNEELQSTNEELETAKEELQSTNEELRTVNEELENRNVELSHLNNDLYNIIASVGMAIAMVDTVFAIRRFSPKAKQLLNLIDTDIGRPITNIKTNLAIPDLPAAIKHTIETVQIHEQEVQDKDGYWYLLRIHPYRTMDNRIDGAVLVFMDINSLKQGAELVQNARDYAEAVIAAMRHPLLVLDKDLRVVSVSQAYLDRFHVTHKGTVGNRLNQLGNGQWAIPHLQQALQDVISKGSVFTDYEVEHDFTSIGRQTVLVSGRCIAPGPNRETLVLMQIEAIK